MFAPPTSPTWPGGSPGTPELGGEGAEDSRLLAPTPVTRARRIGVPLRWIPYQDRGSGHGQGALLQGTKVKLTPSAAGCGSRCLGQPAKQPQVPPGPRGRRVGEGASEAAPPPPRSRRPVDFKTSTLSRRRSASPYLYATAAALLPPPPRQNTAETTAPRRHLKYRIKNPETPDSPAHNP